MPHLKFRRRMVGPFDRRRTPPWRLLTLLGVLFVCAVLAACVIMQAGPPNPPNHDLPDSTLTPGDVFPGMTAEQVCVPGYSRSVRNVPVAIRKQVFFEYHLAGNHTGYCDSQEGCELDHLVSLALGGSNDSRNLWPQSYDATVWNAHVKDRLEDRLHALVCSHRLTLDVAQRAMAKDWVSSFKVYVGPAP
jgi:hypothetical protein